MEMEMKHSLHNEYRSINKNKIKKNKNKNKKLTDRNDVLGIELVDKLVLMLAAEGGFVELEDGAEGGDVGGGVEGGFVELGEDGEFEDLGLRVWRE